MFGINTFLDGLGKGFGMGMIVGMIFMFSAFRVLYSKEKGHPYSTYRSFEYALRVIKSCGTYQELITTQNWISNIATNLDKGAFEVLQEELTSRETEMMREFKIAKKENLGRVQ